MNQTGLSAAFGAPPILAGFFAEKLAVAEKIHSSPLPKASP
jgi:hypothetical protein